MLRPNHLKLGLRCISKARSLAALVLPSLSAEQRRIRALERELAIAREERDRLKKATVYSMGQRNTYT